MKNWLEVGKIAKTHGVKGAVKIISYLDGVNFSIFKKIYLGNNKDCYTIKNCLPLNGGAFSVTLAEIPTIEQAEKLKNQTIYIDRAENDVFKNSVFLSDLIGSDVLDENGNSLGVLIDVNDYGATTILEIKSDFTTYSMPYVEDYIWYDQNNKTLTTTKKIFEDMRV